MKLYRVKSKFQIITLLKTCLLYSPIYSVLCIALTVIEGLVTPFMLFSVARFIDSVVESVSLHTKISTMLFYMGITIFGYLYKQVVPDIRQYVFDLLLVDLKNSLNPDIIKKQYTIDYLVFERPETQDLLLRVVTDIEGKIVKVINSFCIIISLIIQIVGILGVVVTYNYLLVLIYMAMLVAAIIITFKNGRIIYQEDKKVGLLTRKMNYLADVLTSRDTVKERTLFGYSGV